MPTSQRPRPVLYRNGSVYSPADPFATAMLVDGGTVAWVGTEHAATNLEGPDVRTVDLDGALIAPGFVDTKFAAAVLKNDALLDEVLRITPMKRYGQPEEIAGAALYLASDSASYLTGQAIVIDGGMTIA